MLHGTRAPRAEHVDCVCGNDDLRTRQSSVRAAGRYAGGGGAVRIVRAEPASLLTVVPSIISHSSSRICIAQSAASTQSLSLIKGFGMGLNIRFLGRGS